MAKKLEELLASVGGFGSYQRWMVGFVIIPTSFIVAYVNISVLFQLAVPDHWCYVPGRTRTSLSSDQWKKITIPRENGMLSKCFQYKLLWKNDSKNTFAILNETEACIHGWQHDNLEFLETVATTNNWFCGKGSYSDNIVSITTIGNAIGTLLIPVISDKYVGRRVSLYVVLGLQASFTAAVVWAPSYYVHLAFRFLAGLSYQANYQLPYITVFEFLPPDKRAVVALLSCVSWTAGLCFSTLVSWILPDWRYQALACCVPLILSFMYIFCLPESPRWLLTHGKVKECTDIFIKIAEINGKPPPERSDLESQIQLINIDQTETCQWKIIRYPKLCLRSLMLFIIGSCAYIIHGIVNYSISIDSSYFLNHLVLSISELPGTILGCLFVHHFGRRFTFICTTFLATVFCLAALFVIQDKWKLLAAVVFIKLFISQLIYIFYVYNAEIFPTPIRSTGIGWMTVCGFTAITASSYVMHSDYGATFPYWIILALSGICLLASLPLPETLGLPLPQTFQEAENIGVGRPLKVWIHKWNYLQYLSLPHSHITTYNKQELKHLKGDFDDKENEVLEEN